jgi:hypothetical protein
MFQKSILFFALTAFVFGSYYCKAQLTSTNLPIVLLNVPVVNDTLQVQGNISIINNTSGVNTPTDVPQFAGMTGVTFRGGTSLNKKSYSIETWLSNGVSNDVSLLGMPVENDWVLIASHVDRSFVRNLLSYQLHANMGRYATRMKLCEVLVNNNYEGVYLFGEKLKKDTFRLDISKLDVLDVSGENLTGGYILKLDNGGGPGFNSLLQPPFAGTQQIKFLYEYPNANDIVPVQKDYIKAYIDSFELAMNASNFQDTAQGWRRFASEGSFVDYMIIEEVSKNEEAYRINAYLFKDKSKKLRVGPMWNAEASWHNTAYCQGASDTGFCYNLGAVCSTEARLVPFWYSKLNTDSAFMQSLTCAYKSYRMSGGVLDTAKIFSFIDSVSAYANAQGAIARNFAKWPIWQQPLNNEPLPMAANHAQEIVAMKTFIKARLAWLDSKWVPMGACAFPASVAKVSWENDIQVYPNPTQDFIEVKNPTQTLCELTLFTMQGKKVFTSSQSNNQLRIDVKNYAEGVYLLQVKTSKGTSVKRIVKQ